MGIRGRGRNLRLHSGSSTRIFCAVFTLRCPREEQAERFEVGTDSRLLQAAKVERRLELINLSNRNLVRELNVSGKEPEATLMVGNGVGGHAGCAAVVQKRVSN